MEALILGRQLSQIPAMESAYLLYETSAMTSGGIGPGGRTIRPQLKAVWFRTSGGSDARVLGAAMSILTSRAAGRVAPSVRVERTEFLARELAASEALPEGCELAVGFSSARPDLEYEIHRRMRRALARPDLRLWLDLAGYSLIWHRTRADVAAGLARGTGAVLHLRASAVVVAHPMLRLALGHVGMEIEVLFESARFDLRPHARAASISEAVAEEWPMQVGFRPVALVPMPSNAGDLMGTAASAVSAAAGGV